MESVIFEKLPEEKRRAVINAGLTCFGKDGYHKTAMREIAAAAGVSKAAMFHYFGNKKDFYIYLFNYARLQILEKMRDGTEDFFECVEIDLQIKKDVIDQYPGMYDFLASIVLESDAALINELLGINAGWIEKSVNRLLEKVDWSRLKPGIGVREACDLVVWVSYGYVKTFTGKKNGGDMAAELKRYLAIIKQAVYKEEFW